MVQGSLNPNITFLSEKLWVNPPAFSMEMYSNFLTSDQKCPKSWLAIDVSLVV